MCRRRSIPLHANIEQQVNFPFVPRHTAGQANSGTQAAVILSAICLLSGCIQEMANQPRYEALEPSEAFDDGMSSRAPVPGAIARGQLPLEVTFTTGKADGQFVTKLPDSALAGRSLDDLLARGQERFTVFCSHCHGRLGGGIGGDAEFEPLVGMVVKRGYPSPPTYHQDRLRRAPIGHFFDVITNGNGRMPSHAYLIPAIDRWAIAAYIRTLQLSQYAARDALTATDLQKLAGPVAGSQ
jgi:mono/diheme cytochrome c family protein